MKIRIIKKPAGNGRFKMKIIFKRMPEGVKSIEYPHRNAEVDCRVGQTTEPFINIGVWGDSVAIPIGDGTLKSSWSVNEDDFNEIAKWNEKAIQAWIDASKKANPKFNQ
jgi:hypothetical protein